MVRQNAIAMGSPKPMVGSRINGEADRHRNTSMNGMTSAMKMPTAAPAADDQFASNDMFGDSSDDDAPTGPPEPEEEDVRLSFTRVISV